MDTTTRDSLLSLFQNILGKSLDAKTLSYWTNRIAKGENTMQDFESVITCDVDYKERIRQQFKAAYHDLIGYDNDPRMSDIKDFEADHVTTIPKRRDIETWIKCKSADYEKKFTGIIDMVYRLNTESVDCPIEVSVYYLDLFRNKEGYDVHALEHDIKAAKHVTDIAISAVAADVQPASLEGHINISAMLMCELADASPAIKDLIEKSSVTDLAQRVASSFSTRDAPQPTIKQDALAMFEVLANRPMFVREYFKYIIESKTMLGEADMRNIINKQVSNYNVMHTLYKNYTNIELSEWSFINKHIYDVDDPNFFHVFVEHIVTCDEYKVAMVKVLNEWNHKLYDTTLDAMDLDYVFNKVKADRIGLNDDKIIEILKTFKNETDTFVEHIFDVFQLTLERQPDVLEITKYIDMYRGGQTEKNIDTVDISLSKILISELEFHDIIKQHIEAQYLQHKLVEIKRNKLYETLSAILKDIGSVTMQNLDSMIEKLIK